jgi:hypothetical protein
MPMPGPPGPLRAPRPAGPGVLVGAMRSRPGTVCPGVARRVAWAVELGGASTASRLEAVWPRVVAVVGPAGLGVVGAAMPRAATTAGPPAQRGAMPMPGRQRALWLGVVRRVVWAVGPAAVGVVGAAPPSAAAPVGRPAPRGAMGTPSLPPAARDAAPRRWAVAGSVLAAAVPTGSPGVRSRAPRRVAPVRPARPARPLRSTVSVSAPGTGSPSSIPGCGGGGSGCGGRRGGGG